jgi:hypothetical protein
VREPVGSIERGSELNENKQSNERGQSLVLVAAALVALVIFVAITVDTSSAYYHRRTAQNAADGAALAGVAEMATEINHRNKQVDDNIKIAMNDFAERNGIEDTDDDPEVNANVHGFYVDMSGNRVPTDPPGAEVGYMGDNRVPAGAYGIEAICDTVAPTYFGGIFGFDGYPLDARAVSLLKQACSEDCLVPITTDASVLFEDGDIGNLDKIREGCFNIWRENQDEVATPGLYGWVNWTWQEAVCGLDKDPPRACPLEQGTNACDSPVLAMNLHPDSCASGFVQVGDWMSSTSGVINADDIRCLLSYYYGSHDEDCNERAELEPQPFTIPVYEYTNMDLPWNCDPVPCLRMKDLDDECSGGLHYKVVGFAQMQLLGFQLSEGTSGGVSVGHDGTGCWTEASAEPYEGNRITAEFLNYVTDFSSSNPCYDPLGTLLSAPKLTE